MIYHPTHEHTSRSSLSKGLTDSPKPCPPCPVVTRLRMLVTWPAQSSCLHHLPASSLSLCDLASPPRVRSMNARAPGLTLPPRDSSSEMTQNSGLEGHVHASCSRLAGSPFSLDNGDNLRTPLSLGPCSSKYAARSHSFLGLSLLGEVGPAGERWHMGHPAHLPEELCRWDTVLRGLCLHGAVQTMQSRQEGLRVPCPVIGRVAVILEAVGIAALVHVRHFAGIRGGRHDFINLQGLHTSRQAPSCTVEM